MTSSLQRLHEETDQMLGDIINERRASRVEKKTGENEIEAGDDLLDVLLNLQDDGNFKVKTESIKSIILVSRLMHDWLSMYIISTRLKLHKSISTHTHTHTHTHTMIL
jgi:uncharacterized protein YaaR (DUF327 family)